VKGTSALPVKVCTIPCAQLEHHSLRPYKMRVATSSVDDTGTEMRFFCEDQQAIQSALSRSARLADMHRVDPEGCVRMPCDTRTWTTWLTNDPSRVTADDMELMLDVIMVRPYTAFVHSVRTMHACKCCYCLHRSQMGLCSNGMNNNSITAITGAVAKQGKTLGCPIVLVFSIT
jgi:hypothetical protein